MFELDDRIEAIARRFAPDLLPQAITDATQSQSQCENFGNALDGERHFRIAAQMHLAIEIDQRHAKTRWVDIRKLGNIARDASAIFARAHLLGDLADYFGEIRIGLAHHALHMGSF